MVAPRYEPAGSIPDRADHDGARAQLFAAMAIAAMLIGGTPRNWRAFLEGAEFRLRPAARQSLGRRLPVRRKTLIDQRDLGIDRRMPQALLKGDELDQLVGAFDIGRAILQRARRGRRAGQALRRSGVFF